MVKNVNSIVSLKPPRLEGCRSVVDFDGFELFVEARIRKRDPVQLRPNIETFLPIAILMAGEGGLDLRVEASLDDAYYAGINLGFCSFISDIFGYRRPRLERAGSRNYSSVPTIGKSALMFSGGVDSFYSLKCLIDLGIAPDYLLNIHAGAHGDSLETMDVRLKNIDLVSDALGIPIIEINTNFHVAFKSAHVRCATIRNMAACLSMAPVVSTFYYSSAIAFRDISFKVAKEHGIHFIDHAAIADLLLPGVRAVEIGYDATRSQKTLSVAEFELSHRLLDVCTNQSHQESLTTGQPINCGKCAKCLRTIATLEHQGNLQKFSSVFELDTWIKSRRHSLEYLRSSHEPLDQEVLEYLKDEFA